MIYGDRLRLGLKNTRRKIKKTGDERIIVDKKKKCAEKKGGMEAYLRLRLIK